MSDNPFDEEQPELQGQQMNRIASLRRDCASLWSRIDKLVPGRYGALAKTDLERVFHWSKEGIERSET